eukprot:scaffold313688_cov19-Tisochrysis_lutea.AAC.1
MAAAGGLPHPQRLAPAQALHMDKRETNDTTALHWLWRMRAFVSPAFTPLNQHKASTSSPPAERAQWTLPACAINAQNSSANAIAGALTASHAELQPVCNCRLLFTILHDLSQALRKVSTPTHTRVPREDYSALEGQVTDNSLCFSYGAILGGYSYGATAMVLQLWCPYRQVQLWCYSYGALLGGYSYDATAMVLQLWCPLRRAHQIGATRYNYRLADSSTPATYMHLHNSFYQCIHA